MSTEGAGLDGDAARVGLNDARFREANERIQDRAVPTDVEFVPFICECADRECADLARMTTREYESVRAHPAHFLCVPGHEVDAERYGRVVARNRRYVVVEKTGDAALVARRLDPRGKDEALG